MPRIGELLLATNLITREQCQHALQAQVMWGGRLGTSLVELGFLQLDELSKALGRQQRHPAALAQHFETADRGLQARLSPELAERFSCIPLLRVGTGKVVVASISPLDVEARELVANELGVSPFGLLATIAAELRIRYHLESVYKIPRDTRFLRARGAKTFPRFEILDVKDTEPDLEIPSGPVPALTAEQIAIAARRPSISAVEGMPPLSRPRRDVVPPDQQPPLRIVDPHEYVSTAAIGRAPTVRDRRRYVPSLADDQSLVRPSGRASETPDNDQAPKRLPISTAEQPPLKRLAIGTDAMLPLARGTQGPPGSTLGDATRAIRRSTDRDTVAQLVIHTIARFVPASSSAILFVVRGELAIGLAGFSRTAESLPEIAVPMDVPSLVPAAIRLNQAARASSTDVGVIDFLLLETLGTLDGDLVVVPISVADQVIGVIAMATAADASTSCAEMIASAAGAAFTRLMRDASR